MSQDDIKKDLENLSSQLDRLFSRIEHAPSLNGGFDRLVSTVEAMHNDIGDIKKIVLGDGERMGVAHRVMQLEAANTERNRYLQDVVEPAFKEHQQMLFRMEAMKELLQSDEQQKKEITLLKERVGILNKIMWLFGSGLTAMIVKAMFEMMTVAS
jgi:hypothetical protein